MKCKERRYKTFVSLNLKITVAIFVGLFLAVCMYVACTLVENYVGEVRYTSDAAVEKNIGEAYNSLEKYIKKEHVAGSDSKALSAWIKGQEYTYFTVYDNQNIYFESGWWSNPQEPGAEVDESNADTMLSDGSDNKRIDRDTAVIDTKNRIIKFADQEYYVFIDQYKEQQWHQIMNLVTLFLCFLTLLVTILVYNGRMLKRIILLSTEIKRVSDGDLDYFIHARHNDEIGELADAVDNMRTSILEKHKNEKEAWEANTQLITAMSHDVRTPLTSMIGYLDIIEGKKYENTEQLDKYVASCREKAFQLKDLSDKLFQYFLVFGNSDKDKSLERCDASILFQQLLMEHCAEIIGYGYTVTFDYTISEVDVMVDISGMRRLFDNLFSNIMKYADKKAPIVIAAKSEADVIRIEVTNVILENAKKVESTRIGLKTCEKICADSKGTFNYEEEERIFTAKITLPSEPHLEEPEEPQEPGEEAEEEPETLSEDDVTEKSEVPENFMQTE